MSKVGILWLAKIRLHPHGSGALGRHPDQPVAPDQLADRQGRGVGTLLDERHVEVTGLDAPEQQLVLEHGQLDVDARVELPERPQDPGQRREGEVVGHPEPQPPLDL